MAQPAQSVDDYFSSTPLGSKDKALTNNLLGIDHRQIPGILPMQKDSYGFTFVVRPQLNLSRYNLSHQPVMYPLLTEEATSIQRYIRAALDPRCVTGFKFGKFSIPGLETPIIMNDLAFIAPMTNNLISISGWPDPVTPTYTSSPGLYGEVFMQVDGKVEIRDKVSLTLTFQNVKGDTIPGIAYYWQLYQSFVFEGLLVRYPDLIVDDVIDSTTRIYRFVLDPSKRKVTKFAATGGGMMLTGTSLGDMFNHNRSQPYLEQNKEFTMTFEGPGVFYNHPRVIYDFNTCVGIFNPSMRDRRRETDMVLVPPELDGLFRHRAYPRVNPDTMAMEWWVTKALYQHHATMYLADTQDTTPYDVTGD